MLADKLPSRLVIEITEQTDISDYAELREQLAPWVARGAQIAIDDTGAGYASLEHVVELRPDFLKLTRGLVADIDKDANRQALLRALGAFAREVGAVIVAEGVERREELEVLRESQIDFAQGWLFGRPGRPWPEVPEIEPRRPRPKLTESAVKRMSALDQAVSVATTPAEAAQAAVDHLAGFGILPSIYVQQGERLRCLASHGYYSLFDGIAPEAGLVGRAYRSGTVVSAADVRDAPGYLRSAASVNTSRSVPVRAGSRVVGVVCIESATPIGEEPAQEADLAAAALGKRLSEFGRLEEPTPGQLLARAAARAAAMEDPDAVVREAAAAALEVSGMESVMIALRDAGGRLHAHHCAGPLVDAFEALSAQDLKRMSGWVDPGTSMISMADATGRGDVVAEQLRQAGAGALLVVPLAVGRARLGLLAVADRSVMPPDTERTELIELLGVQTAAQLRGLAAVGQLRDKAARDPLTGLGHEQAFQSRLPRRRAAAAEAGRKVAVVKAELDSTPPPATTSCARWRRCSRSSRPSPAAPTASARTSSPCWSTPPTAAQPRSSPGSSRPRPANASASASPSASPSRRPPSPTHNCSSAPTPPSRSQTPRPEQFVVLRPVPRLITLASLTTLSSGACVRESVQIGR